jgi:hypothetical protein
MHSFSLPGGRRSYRVETQVSVPRNNDEATVVVAECGRGEGRGRQQPAPGPVGLAPCRLTPGLTIVATLLPRTGHGSGTVNPEI